VKACCRVVKREQGRRARLRLYRAQEGIAVFLWGTSVTRRFALIGRLEANGCEDPLLMQIEIVELPKC
jgi:hypothetical protein